MLGHAQEAVAEVTNAKLGIGQGVYKSTVCDSGWAKHFSDFLYYILSFYGLAPQQTILSQLVGMLAPFLYQKVSVFELNVSNHFAHIDSSSRHEFLKVVKVCHTRESQSVHIGTKPIKATNSRPPLPTFEKASGNTDHQKGGLRKEDVIVALKRANWLFTDARLAPLWLPLTLLYTLIYHGHGDPRNCPRLVAIQAIISMLLQLLQRLFILETAKKNCLDIGGSVMEFTDWWETKEALRICLNSQIAGGLGRKLFSLDNGADHGSQSLHISTEAIIHEARHDLWWFPWAAVSSEMVGLKTKGNSTITRKQSAAKFLQLCNSKPTDISIGATSIGRYSSPIATEVYSFALSAISGKTEENKGSWTHHEYVCCRRESWLLRLSDVCVELEHSDAFGTTNTSMLVGKVSSMTAKFTGICYIGLGLLTFSNDFTSMTFPARTQEVEDIYKKVAESPQIFSLVKCDNEFVLKDLDQGPSSFEVTAKAYNNMGAILKKTFIKILCGKNNNREPLLGSEQP